MVAYPTPFLARCDPTVPPSTRFIHWFPSVGLHIEQLKRSKNFFQKIYETPCIRVHLSWLDEYSFNLTALNAGHHSYPRGRC